MATLPGRSLLATIGISLMRHPSEAAARVALVRVAGELLDRGYRVVGLAPVSAAVDALALAVPLAAALYDRGGAEVEIVDAGGRWAEFAGDGASPDDGASSPRRRTIADGVCLATARAPGPLPLSVVTALIDLARNEARVIVVDLAPLRDRGDHLEVIDRLDGVVLVAVAGVTREAELARAAAELPPQRTLGVVLIEGGRT